MDTSSGELQHLARLSSALTLLACLLAGCAVLQPLKDGTPSGGCPKSLREGIRITASVAEVGVPDDVKVPSGAVSLVAGVGRRVLLSVDVPQGLPRARLLSSSLEVLTFGGTLAGWAKLVAPPTASGGRPTRAVSRLLPSPRSPFGKPA